MGVTDLATTDVVTASQDTPITEVLDQMDTEQVGSVVITDGDEPVGIVTDRMVAMAVRDGETTDDMTAEEVMTTDLVTASPDHSQFDVLETMRDEGIRRVPIVENGGLSGIITLDDLIMLTATEMTDISEVIEKQAGTQ